MNQRVAIVMPVRNGARFVRPSVESMLAQSYGDFEFVIVDDGSTDDTLSILEDYASRDARIRLLRQDARGVAAALNAGIASTQADLIVRMDADDVAVANRVQTQVSYLDSHPEIAVLGSFVRIIDDNGRLRQIKRFPVDPEAIERHLLFKNPICHSSVVTRRQALVEAGGYDERFVSAQDHELWLRMSSRFRLANLPEVMLEYRDHATQVTDKGNREFTYIYSCLAIIRHILAKHDFPPLRFMDDSEVDFSQLADQMDRAFSSALSKTERSALYYQAARLLRFYARREGMGRMARKVRLHALGDLKVSYLLRELAYRYI